MEKGDKLRAYHQIRTLAQHNDIYLFAISHQPVAESQLAEMRRYCKGICVANPHKGSSAARAASNVFRLRSLQAGYWYSARIHRRYRKFEAQVKPDVVYSQMVRTMAYVADSPYPKVMDFQDALSMNVERRMMASRRVVNKAGTIHSGSSPRYHLLHYEFKMLRSLEYNAFKIFDALTIISETDSNAIPHHHHQSIHIIPNGVDFDYFRPQEMPKQYDIVFCGNMQYKPNIDAARYLVLDIMPLVWKHCPDAKVLLAGATPKAAVRRLASDKVVVSGSIPDIRNAYASSHIMVAPMRIGSGLQNKLLEAMSMNIPCVTTSLANLSLGAQPDHDILVADSAADIAAAIVRLLGDDSLRSTIATNASSFVRSHFSWEATTATLESVLRAAVEQNKVSS